MQNPQMQQQMQNMQQMPNEMGQMPLSQMLGGYGMMQRAPYIGNPFGGMNAARM
jgi:hypothetical protein